MTRSHEPRRTSASGLVRLGHGLHDDHLSIDLFSLHIDLSGDLAKRIARSKKNRT